MCWDKFKLWDNAKLLLFDSYDPRNAISKKSYFMIQEILFPRGSFYDPRKIDSEFKQYKHETQIRTIIYKMIIPVKCVTCGQVLANKYLYYLEEVRKRKIEKSGVYEKKTVYLTSSNAVKTPEAEVLDEMHLYDPCCRRHMLTHVDIE